MRDFEVCPCGTLQRLAEVETELGNACKLVVDMHAAATGRPGEGPRLGVVEDVAAVRAEREALRDAFRKGFYAGFAATGEGWNGEYPFQDTNRPIAGDPDVEATLDAAIAKAQGGGNG